jgi:GNAT superfamily N-acetyltransferase
VIRLATLEDVPALVLMGLAFHEASGYAPFISINAMSLAKSLRRIIRAEENARLVVYDRAGVVVAAAGVVTTPSYFNADVIVGTEQFIFVSPDFRGAAHGSKLIDALEKSAKELGCQTLSLACLETLSPDLLHDVYLAHGYTLMEHMYIKRL